MEVHSGTLATRVVQARAVLNRLVKASRLCRLVPRVLVAGANPARFRFIWSLLLDFAVVAGPQAFAMSTWEEV